MEKRSRALLVTLMMWVATFIIIIVALMVKHTPSSLPELQGRIPGSDFQKLTSLEMDFCRVCNGQTSIDWQVSKTLAQIVKERDAILNRNGLLKNDLAIFPRTSFNWQCHYDDAGGKIKKCETE